MDKRNNTFKVINTTAKDIEILDLLGVNNSSVFLSNCTIWVEGISDKILISKYLNVYMSQKNNKYKEDTKIIITSNGQSYEYKINYSSDDKGCS